MKALFEAVPHLAVFVHTVHCVCGWLLQVPRLSTAAGEHIGDPLTRLIPIDGRCCCGLSLVSRGVLPQACDLPRSNPGTGPSRVFLAAKIISIDDRSPSLGPSTSGMLHGLALAQERVDTPRTWGWPAGTERGNPSSFGAPTGQTWNVVLDASSTQSWEIGAKLPGAVPASILCVHGDAQPGMEQKCAEAQGGWMPVMGRLEIDHPAVTETVAKRPRTWLKWWYENQRIYPAAVRRPEAGIRDEISIPLHRFASPFIYQLTAARNKTVRMRCKVECRLGRIGCETMKRLCQSYPATMSYWHRGCVTSTTFRSGPTIAAKLLQLQRLQIIGMYGLESCLACINDEGCRGIKAGFRLEGQVEACPTNQHSPSEEGNRSWIIIVHGPSYVSAGPGHLLPMQRLGQVLSPKGSRAATTPAPKLPRHDRQVDAKYGREKNLTYASATLNPGDMMLWWVVSYRNPPIGCPVSDLFRTLFAERGTEQVGRSASCVLEGEIPLTVNGFVTLRDLQAPALLAGWCLVRAPQFRDKGSNPVDYRPAGYANPSASI
ncbi:hypothetical protein B0T21DRAFT_343634 [Apiosordaria backusii]|uniref:Uncharacterized protein n=1 Tax=Apiosordaria backusii TaxID=314023 RepID=A0AA40K6L5_9PEZI|nr:hypothetical protein B0T21DRAFT_343634 [Apiosordaria backusii]